MVLFKWLSVLFMLSLTIPALSITEPITKENYTTVACDTNWWQNAQLHQVRSLSENFTSDQIVNTFCGDEENSFFQLAVQVNPYSEVIEYLFDMGFYIEDENLSGQNAFALATMNENPEILQTLNALKDNNENTGGYVNYNVVQEIFKEENTQGFRGPAHEEVKKQQDTEWYKGISIGTSLLLQARQEGWNYDTFCYPDEDCSKTPPISGYRWAYDIEPEGLSSRFGEVFIGADHGPVRWDVAFRYQQNNIHQNFTDSNSYTDPDLTEPITPIISNDVSTNVTTEVNNMTINSIAFSGYYDFFESSSGTTIYAGVGVGTAHTKINDLEFSIEYVKEGTKKLEEEFPPLSFYNSRQNVDISQFLPLFQFHAGFDVLVGDDKNKSIGAKLSFSKIGQLTHEGRYSTHPMHSIDPNFPNYNTFRDIQFLTAMMVFKWH